MKFDAHSGKFELVAVNFRIVWRPNHWHLKEELQKSGGCGSEFKTQVRSLCTNSWSIPLIKFYDCDNSNKRISLEKNLNHSASIREGPYVHRSSIVRLCYCLYYKRILTFHFLHCKKQDAPCKSQLPWLLYLLFFFQWCVLKRSSMWKQCFQYI